MQTQAAGALANLCCENVENQDSVRECGGVVALVALLAPSAAPAVRARAAAALGNLCMANARCQDSVRECGGIAALVGLLAPGGPAAVLDRAAGALANVCARNVLNQDSVRECGGRCGAGRAAGAHCLVCCACTGRGGTGEPVLQQHKKPGQHAAVRGHCGAGRSAGARRLCASACRLGAQDPDQRGASRAGKQSGHSGGLQPWRVCLHARARQRRTRWRRLRCATWGMSSRWLTTHASQADADMVEAGRQCWWQW